VREIYNFDMKFYTNKDIIGNYDNPAHFPLLEWKRLYSRSVLIAIFPIQDQIKYERHQS
jgi:hypothetical protein